MKTLYLKTLMMSILVLILCLGIMISCGSDSDDDGVDGDTGGIGNADGDDDTSNAKPWDDKSVDDLLKEACDKLMTCDAYPDHATCMTAMAIPNYEKCELACFAGNSCDRLSHCHEQASAEYQNFCGDGANTDGDYVEPIDSHELFEYCGEPRDTCEEHVCTYYGAYNICNNRDEDYCDDTLPCVKNYKDCVCPGGNYDASKEVSCTTTAAACIVEATPDPGDNDTDFNASKCENDISFMATECGMATCPFGLKYNECVQAGKNCSALNDCIQTFWDCACTGGTYQGGQTQYDCGVTYVECERAAGF